MRSVIMRKVVQELIVYGDSKFKKKFLEGVSLPQEKSYKTASSNWNKI